MIDSEKVHAAFKDALFRDEEIGPDGKPTTEPVVVEGIMARVGFNRARLESHRVEIDAWLDDLPTEFREKEGGGWSFLNACYDRHGEQWTGFHERMDQLLMLGSGIGRVVCQLPRSMWEVLPGGMPYYAIKERQS